MDNREKLEKQLLLDPRHVYNDDELDAIEKFDAALALRIARAQHFSKAPEERIVDDTIEIDMTLLNLAIAEVRKILSMDGGDIELVDVVDHCVRVKLKGACVGCPNAVLDLKNVVERILFDRVAGVKSVVNTF